MSTGGMAATAVDEVTSARPQASALTETALRSDFTRLLLVPKPDRELLERNPSRARAQLTGMGMGHAWPADVIRYFARRFLRFPYVINAASGNVCPVNDAAEPFVVGVVIAPDD